MPKDKKFIDPATATLLGGLALKGVFQAVCGWLAVQAIKPLWQRYQDWRNRSKDGPDQGVPEEESQQKD